MSCQMYDRPVSGDEDSHASVMVIEVLRRRPEWPEHDVKQETSLEAGILAIKEPLLTLSIQIISTYTNESDGPEQYALTTRFWVESTSSEKGMSDSRSAESLDQQAHCAYTLKFGGPSAQLIQPLSYNHPKTTSGFCITVLALHRKVPCSSRRSRGLTDTAVQIEVRPRHCNESLGRRRLRWIRSASCICRNM